MKDCVELPVASAALSTTLFDPIFEFDGVPVRVAVLFPLSVRVNQVGNVVAVIVVVSPSSSETVILYV